MTQHIHPLEEVALSRRQWLRCTGAALACSGFSQISARGDEVAPEVQRSVARGLDWLVKMQHRDGHWEGSSGQYPTSMTALAGMALLMEGSTLREGKYAPSIRRSVDWFLERSQRNGLLCKPSIALEA